MKPSLPLSLSLLLALAHVGMAVWELTLRHDAPVTYVFTPLVDVWPDGAALEPQEGQALGGDLRHGIDARGMAGAYARLGATLSLADLVVGVDGLEGALAMSPEQETALGQTLADAQAEHTELVSVQAQILDLEAAISARVARLSGDLPAPLTPRGPPLQQPGSRPPGSRPPGPQQQEGPQ